MSPIAIEVRLTMGERVKQILLFIFLGLFSLSATAGNRVVMLVSLDPETNRPPLRFRSWDINEKLEKLFKRKLKKENLELVIIPFVRQTELRNELLNPSNHAVFWVGHANRADSLATAGMYDDRGFNLKEIFQEVHQNIKFLGLVGCRALPFIQGLKEKGHWDLNSHLSFYARDKKTDARKGLKRAIKAFLNFKEKPAPVCLEKELLPITVRRKSDSKLSAARILRKGVLVGTFEEDQDEIIIYLPKGLKKSEYKLTFESGAPNNISPELFNLGRLEFESLNPELSWKLFADREGKPLGFGAHVYRFTGKLNNQLITKPVLPNQCNTN
tara:strand:+ start:157969 stop:158952 length:984 start_codon:yes stop_codon:yes gene_type:complete